MIKSRFSSLAVSLAVLIAALAPVALFAAWKEQA